MGANKRFDPILTQGLNRVLVGGSFRPNGASGTVASSEKGKGWSVARTSAGLYTITFDDAYNDMVSCHATARVADATPTFVQCGDYSSTAKTLQIRVLQCAKQVKTIQLPLYAARELNTNAPINAAGNGGLLASDTTPLLEALTSAKEIGISWAASNNDAISWVLALPPDFDETTAVTLKAMAQVTKAGGAIVDHVPLTFAAFFGTNGTDAGGDTQHITTGTMMMVSKALTVGNQVAAPNSLTVKLLPTAHTTDSIEVGSVWLEYTSKEYGAPVLADMAADVDAEISFNAIFRNTSVNY